MAKQVEFDGCSILFGFMILLGIAVASIVAIRWALTVAVNS